MSESRNNLEKALSELHIREKEFETACLDAADAEATYRINFAKKFLEADGSMDMRKQLATQNCEKEIKERFRTDAVEKFTREKLRDAQTAASIRQSLFSADTRSNLGDMRRQDVP